ncbi:tetratricopeptide repeat protein [Chryseolinea sp. T2]|uniref:tetratricopeptide repeat protein n=1 Tax=Chryseolinea sp. T2 TaxID=3129255 RepID=UPI0030772040
MSADPRFQKIQFLLEYQKYAEAEKIIADLLREDANNPHLLSLLAEVFLQQDKYDEATRIIDNAIGLSPGASELFYMKSRISIEQDNLSDAEKQITQAIELDPNEAAYFALSANIKLARKKFEEALETANRALEIDAENLLALNTRSSALIKLDRKEESYQTIKGALREDPNNAYTHANYGWGLLEKGDHKKALEHFKESLTNDPNFKYAQAGMLEAIKATNPVYRLFLRYSFWMGNLTAKYQWVVLIGYSFVFRVLKRLATQNEALRPFLIPILVILFVVAFSTWIMTPISNLFLRFNKYGLLLLDKKEKLSSNLVAVSLAICVVSLIIYAALSDERYLTTAAFGFAMMPPLGTMFAPSKNKYGLLIYTIVLGVVGVVAIANTFTTGVLVNGASAIFMIGFFVFQWVANWMLIKESNH